MPRTRWLSSHRQKASEGRGLGRRAREIALRNTKDSAQFGEEVAENVLIEMNMVVSNRVLSWPRGVWILSRKRLHLH